MFDSVDRLEPAFFEFFSPVYFEGVGYVDKVALCQERASADSPAVREYVSAADGYLFVLENGSASCVSGANVKFLAGKLAGVVDGAGDGKQEGVRSKSVAGDSDKGSERQNSAQDSSPKSATPSELPAGKGTPTPLPRSSTQTPSGPSARVPRQPKRGGAW